MAQLAVQELSRAFTSLGLQVPVENEERNDAADRSDGHVVIGGVPYLVEHKSVIRGAEAAGLLTRLKRVRQPGEGTLVIADRIADEAKEVFRKGGVGWLDRRGHLRLLGPGLVIDTQIPGRSRPPGAGAGVDPFSPIGRDVSMALLTRPEVPASSRALARDLGARSFSWVAAILRELSGRQLLGQDRRPVVPALFWELAAAWKPEWVPLAEAPGPDDGRFKLSGTLGALWHGAPLATGSGFPPDLYVPDRVELRGVLGSFARPREDTLLPAARVALCPSRFGWDLTGPGGDEFPVAALLVVALDLTQDPRGREALGRWNPTGGGRVW